MRTPARQARLGVRSPVKRIYIAGPMSGLPGYNFPAFHAAAETWRAHGYEVVNPAENNDTSQSYEWYIRRAILGLLECDTIVMLPGWERSHGARMEHAIATNLGMTMLYGGGE